MAAGGFFWSAPAVIGGMRQPRLKLYFDGGARPNPGCIEAAVVLRGQAHYFDDLGHGTCQDAEWLALIAALRMAQAQGLDAFELIGDAAHVIAQANGQRKCPDDAARAHFATFTALAASHAPARIRWTRRAQNLAGIALEARRR